MNDQGVVYSEFIAEELKHEYERRDRIDTRSAASVTGAAGLTTISIAALAIVKGKDFKVDGLAAVSVVLAVVAFVSSAALATLAVVNWQYDLAKATTLATMLSSHWQDSEVTARNHTAQLNIRTLRTLRAGNNRKAAFFLAALISQVVAVIALAVTVLAIL